MRHPYVSRVLALLAFTCTVTLTAACGGNDTAGATGTTGSDVIGIQITPASVVVSNKSPDALVDAVVEIVPKSLFTYKTTVPRLEPGATATLPLNSFNSADGTPFNRGVAPPRLLRIVAKDLTGKQYQAEVPFQ